MRAEQMDLFMEIDAGDERAALILRNRLHDQYRLVDSADMYAFRIPEGTEIIVERGYCDPKTGSPLPKKAKYYRTILGKHRTVGGESPHLVWAASDEWPEEPPWQMINGAKWIYPDSGWLMSYWTRKTPDENGLSSLL